MPLNETLDPTPTTVDGVGTSLPATAIRKLQEGDREPIEALLVETGVFRPDEIAVALELVDVVLRNPNDQDYDMFTCVDAPNAVVGFLCIGPTPMTKGTFDLYWIAVKPTAQRCGVGKRLLAFGEELVVSKNGRMLVAETSSQPLYLPSRTFYLHNGFTEVGHITDYYDVGDDLIIYAKYLPAPSRPLFATTA